MNTLRLIVLVTLLTSGAAIKKRAATNEPSIRAWLREEFPNPERESESCRAQSMKLCDPDALFSSQEIQSVEESLAGTRTFAHQCPKADREKSVVDVQFAAALVRKMDLSPFGRYDETQEKGARVFAQYLHDEWGVGVPTSCGGTGVLIFLSDRDRVVHISRGAALEAVLTDRRLDRTIEHMKPLLEKKQYGDAIVQAIKEMEFLIQLGEPAWKELINDWIVAYTGMAWFAVLVGVIITSLWKQARDNRVYAQVESHLDELDRARAEALQGRFLAVSCPICLENFHPRKEGKDSTQNGSDGLPLKLLRCGHVFDEKCWAEWVNNGHGSITKCPVCKQDVGGSSDVPSPHNPSTVARRAIATEPRDTSESSPTDDSVPQGESRILQQYTRERNFRLTRLGARYPQYIRPQQLQRWTQSTHSGSLARDPSFVKSNPQHQNDAASRSSGGHASRNRNGSSSSSGGFGGGSSGGGRSGRW